MVEPQDHVLEMLKQMRRENRARFNAMSRDISALHGRLDLLSACRSMVASHNDIAAAKRAALREMFDASIARGGANSADDVRRAVAERLPC